jgi:hypothetical protein
MKKDELIEFNEALLDIIEEIKETIDDDTISAEDTVVLISNLLDSISPENEDENEDEDEEVSMGA